MVSVYLPVSVGKSALKWGKTIPKTALIRISEHSTAVYPVFTVFIAFLCESLRYWWLFGVFILCESIASVVYGCTACTAVILSMRRLWQNHRIAARKQHCKAFLSASVAGCMRVMWSYCV